MKAHKTKLTFTNEISLPRNAKVLHVIPRAHCIAMLTTKLAVFAVRPGDMPKTQWFLDVSQDTITAGNSAMRFDGEVGCWRTLVLVEHDDSVQWVPHHCENFKWHHNYGQ